VQNIKSDLMSQLFSEQLSLDQPLATKIFQKSAAEDKLAKAYILVGHAKDDKWRLIFELASYLNCDKIKSGEKQSCFIQQNHLAHDKWCTNCRWIEADKHPQALMKLSGNNSKSGKIAVEDTRAFVEEVSKTSPYFRIMVIEEANQEILHRAAANTLLKTIEEPRSQVLMIFFAQAAMDVLPTIISRCQTINMFSKQYDQYFSLVSRGDFEQFLLAQPTLNEEQIQNIVSSFDKFNSENSKLADAINLVETIQSLLKDGIDLQITLDYYITMGLSNLNNVFSEKNIRYAKELFLIGQIAKEQNKHYVSEKALIETFVYAWYRLKKTGTSPLKIQR
jgi:DNA polymerase III subunit delta'